MLPTSPSLTTYAISITVNTVFKTITVDNVKMVIISNFLLEDTAGRNTLLCPIVNSPPYSHQFALFVMMDMFFNTPIV